MKRVLLLLMAAVLLLAGGCNFKVEKTTFNVDRDKVDSIEIQREYKEGEKLVYRAKMVNDPADLDYLCQKLRTLPVRRASNLEPHPIDGFSLIILIQGSSEHHMVLTEKMVYFDQIAYEYESKKTFRQMIDLYDNFGYEEAETEPTKYPEKKK